MLQHEDLSREKYLIEKYIRQELSVEEVIELKTQLTNDDFMQMLMEEMFVKYDEEVLKKKMESVHKNIVFYRRLRRLAAVLLHIFFLGLLWLFISKDSTKNNAIAVSDINTAPLSITVFQRELSRETTLRFEETFTAYEAGNYKLALSLFENELPYNKESTFLQLYYGAVLVGAKQNKKAIAVLEKIIATTNNSTIKNKAQSYLALALLQENSMESVQPIPEKINKIDDSIYKE